MCYIILMFLFSHCISYLMDVLYWNTRVNPNWNIERPTYHARLPSTCILCCKIVIEMMKNPSWSHFIWSKVQTAIRRSKAGGFLSHLLFCNSGGSKMLICYTCWVQPSIDCCVQTSFIWHARFCFDWGARPSLSQELFYQPVYASPSSGLDSGHRRRNSK